MRHTLLSCQGDKDDWRDQNQPVAASLSPHPSNVLKQRFAKICGHADFSGYLCFRNEDRNAAVLYLNCVDES